MIERNKKDLTLTFTRSF